MQSLSSPDRKAIFICMAIDSKVWFVGSNPSRKNDDRMTPFYGTRSMLTLSAWIATLGITNYEMINASNEFEVDGKVVITDRDLLRLGRTLKNQGRCVVALGKIASDALKRLDIVHYRLPHPSPRNRLLNDPIFIEGELAKCREYLENP
jgi:uracil-DNA glycosylase